MRTPDELNYRARYERIPEPIQMVAHHNPLVNRVCKEYAMGHICIWEEALCQMVLGLSRSWAEQERRAFEAAMCALPPIIIAGEKFK